MNASPLAEHDPARVQVGFQPLTNEVKARQQGSEVDGA